MNSEINDLKNHQDKMMERTMDFIQKMAAIEQKQASIDEHLESFENVIMNEIHNNVSDRMTDLINIINAQQKTQAQLVEVQAKQGTQIEGIKETLQEFTVIRKTVNKLEERVDRIENDQKSEAELKKEKIKGRWAVAGALVSAVAAVIAAILGYLH